MTKDMQPLSEKPSQYDMLTRNRTRIIDCTCGWRTPPRTTDSDDRHIEHATVMR